MLEHKASEQQSNEAEPLSDKEFQRAMVEITAHLRAFARTLCGSADNADDLAQTALLKAWAARGSYRAGTNFKAWMFTILRNQFYSEARRLRFTGDYDQEMAERTLSTKGGQEENIELTDVMRAMETLPANYRDALILVAVGDFAYEEVAEICGVALGTVKSRICRARAMLAAAINGGQLPDARHDYVMEGDALDLLFARSRTIANGAVDLGLPVAA